MQISLILLGIFVEEAFDLTTYSISSEIKKKKNARINYLQLDYKDVGSIVLKSELAYIEVWIKPWRLFTRWCAILITVVLSD